MSTDDNIIKLKRIEPPEKIIFDATEYYTLLDLLNDQIIRHMKQAEVMIWANSNWLAWSISRRYTKSSCPIRSGDTLN